MYVSEMFELLMTTSHILLLNAKTYWLEKTTANQNSYLYSFYLSSSLKKRRRKKKRVKPLLQEILICQLLYIVRFHFRTNFHIYKKVTVTPHSGQIRMLAKNKSITFLSCDVFSMYYDLKKVQTCWILFITHSECPYTWGILKNDYVTFSWSAWFLEIYT